MLRIKALVLIVAAMVMGCLVLLHTPYVNGPWYWVWQWRRLNPVIVYPTMLVAAIPFLAAQLLPRRNILWITAAFTLLMLACFTVKIASVLPHTDPPGLGLIPVIVQDRDATSYYTDAAALSGESDLLTKYPHLMQALSLHSRTKPPGPILYWMLFIRAMGVNSTTALVGGLLLGAVCCLSIPATYVLLRLLARDEAAAFSGASFLTLCPGFTLFFPMFDPAYTLLSATMIGLWLLALTRRSRLWAAAVGAALAVTCFIAFHILVIGLFMGGLVFLASNKPLGARVLDGIRLGLIALLTAAAALTIFWLVSGYDAISTFMAAWRNQQELLTRYAEDRPYPATILFDLTDFALGCGWIGAVLVVYYLLRAPRPRLGLVLLGLVQILTVAVLGLLQSETARVWNFMLPLVMLPIGLELCTWPRWGQLTVYVLLGALTSVISGNMKLIY